MAGSSFNLVVRQQLSRPGQTTFTACHLPQMLGPKTGDRRKNFDQECSDLSDASITISSGSQRQYVFDAVSYDTYLADHLQQPGVWTERVLLTPVGSTYPEVDYIMLPQPAAAAATAVKGSCMSSIKVTEPVELFQCTCSKEKTIDRLTLARILAVLPDAEQYRLYFIVPEAIFRSFRIKSISQQKLDDCHQERLDKVCMYVIAIKEVVDALQLVPSDSAVDSDSEDASEFGTEEEQVSVSAMAVLAV